MLVEPHAPAPAPLPYVESRVSRTAAPIDVFEPVPYLSILRRGRRLIAAGALAGLIAGLAWAGASKPSYVAHAQVLVRPVRTNPFDVGAGPDKNVNMFTERELARSGVVAEAARRRMGPGTISPDQTASSLRAHLTVNVGGSTHLLAFDYKARSAEAARLGSQAFAESYLEIQRLQAAAVRDRRRADLEATLAPIAASQAEAQATLGRSAAGSSGAAAAKAALVELNSRAKAVHEDLATLATVDPNGGGGAIVSDASRPTHLAGPSTATTGASGLLIGLVAGVLIAFTRNKSDGRLWSRADVETPLGAPFLGALPSARRRRATGTDVEDRDALRMLRTRLQLIAERHGHRTILVVAPTSRSSSAGAAAAAAALADSLTGIGRRVVLMSTRDSDDTVLHSSGLHDLLTEHRRSADFVLVDAPPALESSECLALLPEVDGVVLVADARHTRAGDLSEARRLFAEAGVPILGAVVQGLRG